MALFSKPQTIHCSCYELGHTWNPSCRKASQEIFLSVFKEALKIYGSVYVVSVTCRANSHTTRPRVDIDRGLSTNILVNSSVAVRPVRTKIKKECAIISS